MTDRARSHGLHSAAAPIVARGEITDHHLHFARTKRREGVGWQVIAHMLGVNRDSLKAKAEVGLTATPSPPAPPPTPKAPKPPKGPDLRHGLRCGSHQHVVLAAIGAGRASRHTALTRVTGLPPNLVGAAMTVLRRKGLMASARHGGDKAVTEAGAAELARLVALAEESAGG